jgi:RHS repeat-associated protein
MEMQGDWQTQAAPVGDRYRFNGKEFSEELGLYDYGARWYDPAIGRWNAVDPLAGEMPGWSPYNYVLGNPISLVDPDGRVPITPKQAIARLNQIATSFQTAFSDVWSKGFSANNSSAWEYSATLSVNNQGALRLRNERTDFTEGRVNMNHQIPSGEQLVGDVHTHQYPLDKGLHYNVAQSATDIWNLESKPEEFSTLVVAGDRLFAVVVLDKKKANSFFDEFGSKKDFQKKFDDLMGKQKANGVESFAQGVSNTVRELLGSSESSGIGFFRTDDAEKTNFIHTNQ